MELQGMVWSMNFLNRSKPAKEIDDASRIALRILLAWGLNSEWNLPLFYTLLIGKFKFHSAIQERYV